MTAVAAVRFITKDGRTLVALGADSEISGGSKRYHGVINCDKAQKLGDSYLLMSGTGPILECVDILQADQDFCDSIRLDNRHVVRELGEVIYSTLKDLIEASLSKPELLDQMGTLLFASPEHIWAVYADLSVLELSSFETAGCGEDIATGALSVLYDQLKEDEENGATIYHADLQEIIRKALTASTKHTLGVGMPVITHAVLPLDPPKKLKKSSKKSIKVTLE